MSDILNFVVKIVHHITITYAQTYGPAAVKQAFTSIMSSPPDEDKTTGITLKMKLLGSPVIGIWTSSRGLRFWTSSSEIFGLFIAAKHCKGEERSPVPESDGVPRT